MEPLTAFAIGSSAAGLLSGLWNSHKQSQISSDQLEMQERLQREQWAREDTAYQRTVNDMRNAGLSPLTMSGTDGAGQVIDTSSAFQGMRDATAYRQQSLDNISNNIANVSNLQLNQANLNNLNANSGVARAQQHLLEVQALKTAGVDSELIKQEISNSIANQKATEVATAEAIRQNAVKAKLGVIDSFDGKRYAEQKTAEALVDALDTTAPSNVGGFKSEGYAGFTRNSKINTYRYGDFNIDQTYQFKLLEHEEYKRRKSKNPMSDEEYKSKLSDISAGKTIFPRNVKNNFIHANIGSREMKRWRY